MVRALIPRNWALAAVLGVIVIAGVTYLAAASSGDSNSEPTTPEAFLERVEAALAEQGEISHVSGETASTAQGVTTPMWFVEAWYDFEAGSMRSSLRKAPGNDLDLPEEVVELRQDGDVYVVSPGTGDPTRRVSTDDALKCFEGEPESLVFGLICDFITRQGHVGQFAVEQGVDFRGQVAHALVALADDGYEFRLFVDPASYIPIGQTTTAPSLAPTFIMATAYSVDGVSRDTLPPDFFAPEGIGYVSQEEQWLAVLDAADLGVPVYWPGRAMTGAGQYEAMLTHVDDRRGPRGKDTPGHVLTLSYRGANGLFRLDYWPGETWDDFRTLLGQGFLWASCAEEAVSTLPIGEMTILRGHEVPGAPALATPFVATPGAPVPTPEPFKSPFENGCPEGDYDRFMAVIRIDGAVVTINAPYGLLADGQAFGVFDTEDGLRTIAEHLRLRQPGE